MPRGGLDQFMRTDEQHATQAPAPAAILGHTTAFGGTTAVRKIKFDANATKAQFSHPYAFFSMAAGAVSVCTIMGAMTSREWSVHAKATIDEEKVGGGCLQYTMGCSTCLTNSSCVWYTNCGKCARKKVDPRTTNYAAWRCLDDDFASIESKESAKCVAATEQKYGLYESCVSHQQEYDRVKDFKWKGHYNDLPGIGVAICANNFAENGVCTKLKNELASRSSATSSKPCKVYKGAKAQLQCEGLQELCTGAASTARVAYPVGLICISLSTVLLLLLGCEFRLLIGSKTFKHTDPMAYKARVLGATALSGALHTFGWITAVLPVAAWNKFHGKLDDYLTAMNCAREEACPTKGAGFELTVSAVFFSLVGLGLHALEFKHVMKQHEHQKEKATRMMLKSQQIKLDSDVENEVQTKSQAELDQATRESNQNADSVMQQELRKAAIESEREAKNKQQQDLERAMADSRYEHATNNTNGGFRIMV
jgi:hypothetical protein